MTLAKINTVAPPKGTLSHQMGFFIHLDRFGVVVFLRHQLLIAGGGEKNSFEKSETGVKR